MNWYCVDISKIFEETESSGAGLTSDQASERLKKYGPNELAEKIKRPPWLLFLGQFSDFMILVLIAAAVISGIIGELTDTIIILIIIFLNAIVGFIQEYRAEKALAALKKMAGLQALVLRDGNTCRISTGELVPGDIVLLESGNSVPADLRLIAVQKQYAVARFGTKRACLQILCFTQCWAVSRLVKRAIARRLLIF